MRSRWSKLPHFLAEAFPAGANSGKNRVNRWALLGALTYLAKTQPTEEVEVTPDGQMHRVHLEPGQALVSLNELARLLGMSRNTVNGLLRQLEACLSQTGLQTGGPVCPKQGVKGARKQGRNIITLYRPSSLAGYENSEQTGGACLSETENKQGGAVCDKHLLESREIEKPLPNKGPGLLPPPQGSERLIETCRVVWERAHNLEPRANPEPDWFELGSWWIKKIEPLNGNIDWADELERFENHWTTAAIKKTFTNAKKRKSVAQFRLKNRLSTWIKTAEKRGGSNGNGKNGSGRANPVAVRGKRWE